MRTVPLGRDDTISEIMLGTMTFGTQTPEDDAHAQIDMAIDAGITWLDTAEMYPVNPVREETIGDTETIIGNWIAKGNAGRIRIATKIGGEGGKARGGEAITPDSISRALDASLARLKVDFVDLYQFHWPNRGSYAFRQNWDFSPKGERAAIVQDLADCVGQLEREIERGRIGAFGPSNDSAWGIDRLIAAAGDGPARPVSVQNEYSLMCRLADTDLAETMVYEQVTMLAYSPLAAGLLTGKYADGALPEGSRKAVNGNLGGRWSDHAQDTVDAYVALAAEHGVDPVHMALAWLQTRPFACSAIVGASTSDQLSHALGAAGMTLSDDLVDAIEKMHKARPMPY